MPPETRFARSSGVDIAYQVVGDGPRDVLAMIGWVSHLETMWELPELVAPAPGPYVNIAVWR